MTYPKKLLTIIFVYFVCLISFKVPSTLAQPKDDLSGNAEDNDSVSEDKKVRFQDEKLEEYIKEKVIEKKGSHINTLRVKHLRLIEKIGLIPFSGNLSGKDKVKYHYNQEGKTLKYLTNLKELRLHPSQSDIAFLKHIKSIKKLNAGISDRGMRMFDFEEPKDKYPIKSLNPIKHLKNLKYLNLRGRAIKNVPSDLFENIQLETLILTANYISDISFLTNQKNITYLILSSNPVSNISPLKELTSLKKLALYKCGINDISPLNKMVQMKKLNLTKNKIHDVTDLKNMKNMNWLSLDHNQIKDLTPIRGMSELKTLNVSHNRLERLPDLTAFKQLETLSLQGNPLKNIPTKRFMSLQNLKKLRIDWDTIKNPVKLTNLPTIENIIIYGPEKKIKSFKDYKKITTYQIEE